MRTCSSHSGANQIKTFRGEQVVAEEKAKLQGRGMWLPAVYLPCSLPTGVSLSFDRDLLHLSC